METKVSYTLVGGFVLVLAAAVAAIIVWLGFGDYGVEHRCYYVYMQESVSGLNINAPVKYHGVEVGRVESIKLRPDNPEEVWLTLAIVEEAPINEDTVATLSFQGLTGLAFVNLSTNSSDTPPLHTAQARQMCPVIKTKPSLFVRLDEALSMMVENFQVLAQDIRRLLNDQTTTQVKQILEDIAQLTHTLASHQDTLETGLVSASRTLQMTEHITAKIPATLDSLKQSTEAIKHMAQGITDTTASVSSIVDDNRRNITRFTAQTLPEISLLISELRQLTTNLQQVTRQVEREPNSLLIGRQGPRPGPGE